MLLMNTIGSAISLGVIYAISKNAIDKNKEYLAMTPEERTNQNIALMRRTKEDLKPRGHEKYPYSPAKNKMTIQPKEINGTLIAAMKDTMDKMKASEMNISTTVPVEVKSNPNVTVKVLLDGANIPGRVITTTSNNFSSTRKEIERTERRMGGPTK